MSRQHPMRRVVTGVALAAGVVVLLHVGTCLVTHAARPMAMGDGPRVAAVDHLPTVVAPSLREVATSALLLVAAALVLAVRGAGRAPSPAGPRLAVCTAAPPGDPPSSRPRPSSLCVYRC